MRMGRARTLRIVETGPRVHNTGHWTIEGARLLQVLNCDVDLVIRTKTA